MTGRKRARVLAAGVALAAFALYHATLLPGIDFGDTPSFQVMGGEPSITPRDAYPLYFAVGAPFVWASGDSAHGLNLASATEGAAACALVSLVALEISGSILPALAAALLFGASYTFWSQSIIAEVYALHACMTALSLLLLLRWERKPTTARLALFFAAFAIGFGDHLAMVLLLPGYTVFLLMSAPGGPRSMFAPRIVALAVVIAALGATQYLWNLHSLWLEPVAPRTVAAALSKFWFDVTKSDWRQTMVASVPEGMAWERLRMYVFDVRQQFGSVGPLLAIVGLVHLARCAPRRAWLFGLLFLVNVTFALTYSVGDSHVFFLPSHLMIALLCAPALALLDGWAMHVPSVLALLLAATTAYSNFPALDRSGDTRPTDVLTHLTAGLDDRRDLLLTDLNWQENNALNYFEKFVRPEIAVVNVPDVFPYASRLVDDNLAAGRRVVLTDSARNDLVAAYGSRYHFAPDAASHALSLADLAVGLPPGTRYAVTFLEPPRGLAFDTVDIARALQLLGAGSASAVPGNGDYAAIAGVTGAPPLFVRASDTPFREHVMLAGVGVDIRMESWLAFDTIRRMGFGQVVAAHTHTMIVERGVSLVAFAEDGKPLRQGYQASLFADEPRWAIVSP